MDLSRLPIYHLTSFWGVLSVPARRLLVGLGVVAVLLTGLWVFNFYAPSAWCIDVRAVPQSNSEQVVIDEIERDYQTMNLLGMASYSYVNYIATSIQPSVTLALLLAIALTVGWSMLLAAASRIEGFWGYVIYFFYACFLYFSDFGLLWGGVNLRMAVASALIVPIIALAYLFRSRTITWSIPIQFFVFMGIQAGLFIAAHLSDPMGGLYQTTTYGIPVLLLVALLYTLFISKEFTTGIIFWAGNRKEPAQRKGFGWVLLLSLVVLVLQGLSVAREFNLIPVPSFYFLRPIHFWIIAAGLSVFLSQNLYERVRNVFTAPLAFYGVQVGWMIVALGAMAFLQGAMEYSSLREWHKSIGLVMTVGTFFHVVFLFANFVKVIGQKFNAYALLMLPRTIGIEAVFFSVLAIFILVQGNESWRAMRSWICTFKNMHGDVHLLRQDYNDARNYYREATFFGGDVKSNFNLASIFITEGKYLTSGDTVALITQYYDEAVSRFPFEPAVLNHAHFYTMVGEPKSAIDKYNEVLKKYDLPLAYANLAGLYFSDNQPDPAIMALKKAIKADPSRAELYSNLALIYLRYDKKKEAKQFAQAAYDLAPKNPNVLENYYFTRFYLGDRKDLPFDEKLEDEPEYFLANQNKALAACTKGNFGWANTAVNALMKRNATPEVAFLRMTTQAMLDSFPNAESRLHWIEDSYPEYKPYAYHNIAVAYFSKEVPEMAIHYFDQSAKNGLKINQYNAAKMIVLSGNHRAGYDLMKILLDTFPDIKSEIIREMTLLEYAYDFEKEFLRWNMADISYNEAMRGGLYAYSFNKNLSKVEDFYQKLVDKDSFITAPYYEATLMYLDKGQSKLARENIKWGLKRKPDDVLLNIALARVEWAEGKNADAENRLADLKEPDHPEALILKAEMAFKSKKYEESERLYRQIIAKNPFYKKAYYGIAEVLMRQKKYTKGVELFSKAVQYNNRNDMLWFYFGEFSKNVGSTDWATDAYKNAITYAISDANTNRFADTLKAFEARIYAPTPTAESSEE